MKTAKQFIKEKVWYSIKNQELSIEKDDIVENIDILSELFNEYAKLAIEEYKKIILLHNEIISTIEKGADGKEWEEKPDISKNVKIDENKLNNLPYPELK